MSVTKRIVADTTVEYCIQGHPCTMTRKHIKGGAMLDIKGCKFEQLIRDKVKSKQVKPFEGPVSVSIQYNAGDQYIVDVAKSVLDGLNRCAYKDDCQVRHLSIECTPEANGVTIEIEGEGRTISINLPVKAVGKQEPHSKKYAQCGEEDKVLHGRLQKTANIISRMHHQTSILGGIEIRMDLFTVGGKGDIDNILKFYIESMSMAGVINKGSVLSIVVDIYQDTEERVVVVVFNKESTDKAPMLGSDNEMKLTVLKAVEGNNAAEW